MAKKPARARAESTPESGIDTPTTQPRKRTRSAGQADKTVASDSAGGTSVSMASEPSEDDIRLRAYQRYLQRGGGHGMDFEDWLEAKRELRELNGGK